MMSIGVKFQNFHQMSLLKELKCVRYISYIYSHFSFLNSLPGQLNISRTVALHELLVEYVGFC